MSGMTDWPEPERRTEPEGPETSSSAETRGGAAVEAVGGGPAMSGRPPDEEVPADGGSDAKPVRPGRWAASVGAPRPHAESVRRAGAKAAEKPEASESGIRVIDAENDFPFARVTSVRIGSAHVVVHDGQQELAAVRAMRTVSDQINAWFDPDAAGEAVEVVAK